MALSIRAHVFGDADDVRAALGTARPASAALPQPERISAAADSIARLCVTPG